MDIKSLRASLDGTLLTDEAYRLLYATDASVYRELPFAVCLPKTKNDIIKIINFAKDNGLTIIPRTAGTSLAGQVVGSGIVVDVSNMNRILEINKEESWIRVEPGVILDELNSYLKGYGFFFGPETSTSNRCMIGGMVGNNSAGLHSIVYKTTRDHILSLRVILSNGSEAEFGDISPSEFSSRCGDKSLEGDIYRNIRDILSNPVNRKEIDKEYPDKAVLRRNTGYAIDVLADTEVFSDSNVRFNMAKLLTGSEGTLAFTTEIKLNILPILYRKAGLICVHLDSVMDAIRANLIALKYDPQAVELMDKAILDLTKDNIEQSKNRFFVKGDPGAMLMVEFAFDTEEELFSMRDTLENRMRKANLGYHFPILFGDDIQKAWELRKAGLGVLANIPGDAKPIAFVEDTSVSVYALEQYLRDFQLLLDRYNLSCVYYAHISVGELHIRPVLNLRDSSDRKAFRDIALETAKLVKKYRGSISGEHGDGRSRGEFIPLLIGEHNYDLLRQIKHTWDPFNLFNRGKIVNSVLMSSSLRYDLGEKANEINTIFDFSSSNGMLGMIEKCNGVGACRKINIGIMCPSYMAHRDEFFTTRARANILREAISRKISPFSYLEAYNILDYCLSCKGCKAECPSNVDMTKLKAEYLQKHYDENGLPFRELLLAYLPIMYKIGSIYPRLFNYGLGFGVLKRVLKLSAKREIPKVQKTTLRAWLRKNLSSINGSIGDRVDTVNLFVDEFTNYIDVDIGIKAILVLNKLGYYIRTPKHVDSGRSLLSKGLLRRAKRRANRNVQMLKDCVSLSEPILGIEPSAILTLRDEYIDLVDRDLVDSAKVLSSCTFTIDEFLAREIESERIPKNIFSNKSRGIVLVHTHCYQKAIGFLGASRDILSFIGYSVREIPSGCCGMAGFFGYEDEHYDLSMKIGELVLFPSLRGADRAIICANGTSCRHQIMDGTRFKALHLVEILYNAIVV